jgi:hypothetical protein
VRPIKPTFEFVGICVTVVTLCVTATRVIGIALRYWRIRWKTIGKRSHFWPFAWAAEFIGNFNMALVRHAKSLTSYQETGAWL